MNRILHDKDKKFKKSTHNKYQTKLTDIIS